MSEISNYISRVFFATVWDKNLIEMGAEPLEDSVTVSWEDPEKIAAVVSTYLKDVCTFYGSVCVSAQGRYHCHLSVCMPRAMRVAAAAKLLAHSHTEDQKGSRQQALAYVEKLGMWAEKGEKVLLLFGDRDSVSDSAGARTDLRVFDSQALQPGFNLDRYLLEHSKSMTTTKFLEDRYERLLKQSRPLLREVRVEYRTGAPGCGKTYSALAEYPEAFYAVCSPDRHFTLDGYRGEKVIILDELRPGTLPASELLAMLDRYPYTCNVKGGHFPALWEKVFICSSYPPEAFYAEDRCSPDLAPAFRRRIHEIRVYKPDHTYEVTTWEALDRSHSPFAPC